MIKESVFISTKFSMFILQKYAHTSAKHFFKCPQCNNREEFPKEMLRMGIHIPDR